MDRKNYYYIDEDFTKSDSEYYVMFRTPKNKDKRINKISRIQLIRTSPDSVELKIITKNNKTFIYHYPNGLITLLDNIDIGILL